MFSPWYFGHYNYKNENQWFLRTSVFWFSSNFGIFIFYFLACFFSIWSDLDQLKRTVSMNQYQWINMVNYLSCFRSFFRCHLKPWRSRVVLNPSWRNQAESNRRIGMKSSKMQSVYVFLTSCQIQRGSKEVRIPFFWGRDNTEITEQGEELIPVS